MSPLLPALAGAAVIAGIIGIITGLRPSPVKQSVPRQAGAVPLVHRLPTLSRQTWVLVALATAAGVLVAILTGWIVAVVVLPGAVIALPTILAAPPSRAQIGKLDALQEWTRSLAGVLTVTLSLEAALVVTLRSAPQAIRPEVGRLVARIRSGWYTKDALRAFADDLDDPTGDLVATNLLLGASRRGPGLASVLEALAESVAADVRARRAIEADQAKPRATARLVTLITVGALVVLAATGHYVAPYGTPLGQIILAALLSAYVATLVWMRRMSAGKPLPRFLGTDTKGRRS